MSTILNLDRFKGHPTSFDSSLVADVSLIGIGFRRPAVKVERNLFVFLPRLFNENVFFFFFLKTKVMYTVLLN